jgi:hypothetical protein
MGIRAVERSRGTNGWCGFLGLRQAEAVESEHCMGAALVAGTGLKPTGRLQD